MPAYEVDNLGKVSLESMENISWYRIYRLSDIVHFTFPLENKIYFLGDYSYMVGEDHSYSTHVLARNCVASMPSSMLV